MSFFLVWEGRGGGGFFWSWFVCAFCFCVCVSFLGFGGGVGGVDCWFLFFVVLLFRVWGEAQKMASQQSTLRHLPSFSFALDFEGEGLASQSFVLFSSRPFDQTFWDHNRSLVAGGLSPADCLVWTNQQIVKLNVS